jgi:DNA-binding MarR family transcriptional regulator
MAKLDPMALIGIVHLTWKRRFQASVSRHGITLKHLYVLRQLRRKSCLGPSEIADMLFCDRPTATVAIDTMEKHGWVRREPDPETRKRVRVVATSAGLAKLAEVKAAHRAAQPHPDPLSCLTVNERETLGELLRRVRAHLQTINQPAADRSEGARI